MVIIDEAHHALANTCRQLWNFYPNSKFLGVTATPIRTNGEGFQDLFDKLITTASIKWFIKNNHLSDIRYFASHTSDVSNIKIRAGDYDETELSEVMQDNAVMADLVQSYIDFALNKKMIVFAVNKAHCTKIVEKFNSSGFSAMAIDTYTLTDECRKIVNVFRKVTFPNGKVFDESKAINTLIKTIQELGIEKSKRVTPKWGAPIISEKADNPGVKKNYKQIPNSHFSIFCFTLNH